MDATTDATDAVAIPAARAGDGPLAWQLAALSQPALLFAGDWLPILPRLWVEWAVKAVRSALEQTLDRPVQVEFLQTDPGNLREAVFGISFTHPAVAGSGTISLDLPCARIILDALESDFATVRGAGSLSDAELGLLEYAALATLDGLLRVAPPPAQAFVIRGFHDAKNPARLAEPSPQPGLAVRIRCGGREGTARLYLPGFAAALLSALPAADETAAEIASLDLRVALPPISLASTDARSLQPGDVLLLAAKDLHAFATDCHLATSNGWTLAAAAIIRDSPTLIDVRCGAFSLGILPAASPGSEQAILNPLVGSRRLSTEHIGRWQAGEVIDLAKDTDLPVALFEGLDCVARGELVRLDGELAVRLVEIAPASAKGGTP